MVEPNSPNKLKSGQYQRLRAEAAAPYRGLRKFVYIGIGISGFIGAFVFFFQILAGRNIDQAVPNFALQLGIIAVMVFLWKWDKSR
ncbi:DUF3493 domain-containing protein [Anabaena sp. FACHB-1237]|uniref:DUF3493 domain-containing protein n=1 Tax=Anabaena sp. FACHB-1237 TaxID=2692769 RepID=UPI0016818751|nr:DUF3493 domain-containing protein [Anabaena sp. FACHB-1237]MBD2137529.1 DUF3493 domain-containing protein [Anabaena sp. FACHB-1237]